MPLGLGALALVTITGLGVWSAMRMAPLPMPLSRFVIAPRATEPLLLTPLNPDVVLSPDGRRLFYVSSGAAGGGVRELYMRPMDQLEATLLARQPNLNSPFVSPDGEWVGYRAEG